jgi:hypothetical protein
MTEELVMLTTVRIDIETAIRKLSWASFQAGQKSIHRIVVDFNKRVVSSSFATGHTAVLCFTLSSVRDGFTVAGTNFASDGTAHFKATGQTASGVRVMPNIDYSFDFVVSPSEVRFAGAHDGYPSYNIAVNDKSAYDYVQGHIGQLLGSGDIRVPQKTYVIPIR